MVSKIMEGSLVVNDGLTFSAFQVLDLDRLLSGADPRGGGHDPLNDKISK